MTAPSWVARSTPELGCARDRCVAGAVRWRKVPGAEACALPGQPAGYGYAATVDVRECVALQRRWIAAVNYCASAAGPVAAWRSTMLAAVHSGRRACYVVLSEATQGATTSASPRSEADALSQRAVRGRHERWPPRSPDAARRTAGEHRAAC